MHQQQIILNNEKETGQFRCAVRVTLRSCCSAYDEECQALPLYEKSGDKS